MPAGALNLTLYTTQAVVLLDAEGHRLFAKYFEPLAAKDAPAPPTMPAGLAPLVARNPFPTLKQQQKFEQSIWDKARRASGDLFQYEGHLVMFKASYDVYLFVIAPDRENELMIHSFLQSLYDTLTILLQSQVDKRTVLDNLDLVTIAIDESVDDGCVRATDRSIILETDSAAIANRVTRTRPDTIEVQLNEQSTYAHLTRSDYECLLELPRQVRAPRH